MANYDIAEQWADLSLGKRAQVINLASKEKLRKWASDPNCNQKRLCMAALANEDVIPHLVAPRASDLQKDHVDLPFSHRAEISEDAQHVARVITDHPTGLSVGINLKQELENLTIWDLVRFLWKFWWAALLAGLIPAIVVFVVMLALTR